MKKEFAAILVLLMISACSFGQVDTVSNLSTSDKLYGLSKFWSEASYNFAYFDHAKINWDSAYQAYIPQVLATKSTWEFYRVMSRFCALLKDGHTNIDFPNKLLRPNTSRYRWIFMENFDKRFIVTDIPVQFKDKLPLGSELISVDGIPAKTYAEKMLLPYISASTEHVRWNAAAAAMFYGMDTSQVWHLKFITPAGKTIDHNYQFHTYKAQWVRRATIPPFKAFDFKIINNIAIITINTFGDDKVVESFKAILPQLYTCRGTIIDIRQNGGGDSGIGAEILNYFTDEKLLVGSAWKTRDNISAYRAWGTYQLRDTTKFDKLNEWQKRIVLSARGDYWYKGDTMKFENNITARKIATPLMVLIGNNTASAAEDFLIILSSMKGRAITLGQPTYGSTGQPLPITLPGLSGRICTKRDTYPDGRDFVGVGVIPDVPMARTIADVLNGTDSVLQEALKRMKGLIK